MTTKLPTYFISHGGGPWPYMKQEFGPMYDQLEDSLEAMVRDLASPPKAVLVISGHWEARDFTVMANPQPPMVYDYSGFPPHTYQVTYRSPGSPELATRVQSLLDASGIPARLDAQRGYDHGTFVPLSVMYPEANVPVVQLSLRADYDPAAHLAVGRALAPLRDEGVLIVGSGLSYHNLPGMFGGRAQEASSQFDAWLQQVLTQADPGVRTAALLRWSEAPAARQAHPQEDHLIPLMVAVGAAEQEPGACVYHQDDFFGSVTASSFRFGTI